MNKIPYIITILLGIFFLIFTVKISLEPMAINYKQTFDQNGIPHYFKVIRNGNGFIYEKEIDTNKYYTRRFWEVEQ